MLTDISLLEMVYESGFLGNSRKPKKKKKTLKKPVLGWRFKLQFP